ncbi:MAG: GTP cyclohydrolase II [Deltaproteobacteria bacterium]|nr:MAG: GTP cyclohydrolase II [Deltaproteobacteria bacterium]
MNQKRQPPHAPARVWKPTLNVYAETNLPTEFGVFRTVVFLDEEDQKEHLAMIYGDIEGQENVLVRMHSECFTGEVLHSFKCDCREQLHAGLQAVAESGCGVLIYLRQEGRGIGLGNKIRAYALQEQGYDTVDANRMLGFGDDLRTYEVAFHVLEHFKVQSVRLLTNNPSKLTALEESGITVTERVPHLCPPNPHSLSYFQAKQERMGHMFDASHLAASNVAPTANRSNGTPRHSTQDTRHLHRQAKLTPAKSNGTHPTQS